MKTLEQPVASSPATLARITRLECAIRVLFDSEPDADIDTRRQLLADVAELDNTLEALRLRALTQELDASSSDRLAACETRLDRLVRQWGPHDLVPRAS